MSIAARPALGLAVVSLGTLVAPLDSAVNIAMPSITRAFDAGIEDIRWIVIAYVLTYSSLLLICGKLGDLIGYRRVFRAGLLVAAAGFVACSLAPTYAVLLAGRVVQGIGIALTLSCAPALATTLYDESQRTRVLGLYAAVSAAGAALGPITGGMLVDRFGWSAVFWARAPIALAALALTVLLPAPAVARKSAPLDRIGALLLIVWMSALLLAVAAVARSEDFVLPAGLAVVFMAAVVAFVRHESRHAEPIIRPALFRSLDFSAMNVMSIAVNYAAFSIMLLVPYFLVRARGLDAVTGGIILALAAIGTVVGSSIAGRLAKRTGVGRLALAGIVLSLAGLGGIAHLAREASLWPVGAALIAQGFGVGLFQVGYTDLVTAVLPLKDRGVAGSLAMVTRTIGTVAGATGHAAFQRIFEQVAIAAGATPADAFLAGFERAFQAAAVVVGLALLIALARPGLWRATTVAGPLKP